MLTSLVSSANIVAGRMISGVLALSIDHPLVLCAMMAALAGASCAVLLDVVSSGGVVQADERPIRLWRR